VCCIVLPHVALCCNVLQCVAVCCSVLQCVAVCCSVLQCITVCCSVLQGVAVHCSVLQRVAACCCKVRCFVCQSYCHVFVYVCGNQNCEAKRAEISVYIHNTHTCITIRLEILESVLRKEKRTASLEIPLQVC